MNLFELLFSVAPEGSDGFVEFAVGGVQLGHRKWLPRQEAAAYRPAPDAHTHYFGPALRERPGVLGKENFKCTRVVWVDADTATLPEHVLPPTAIVQSGHGWHLYWVLDRYLSNLSAVERINEVLERTLGADNCHNVDRILRTPGTLNVKDPQLPVSCELINIWPDHIYEPKMLYLSATIPSKVRHKILTGDRRGFHSRSERDWYIVRNLVHLGLDDKSIATIFQYNVCGDKYRDPAENGHRYLERTLERIRATVSVLGRDGTKDTAPVLNETPDGYVVISGRGERRISTFVLQPKLLLESTDGDAIMVNVTAAGSDYVWEDVIIPISAFANTNALVRFLNKAAWIWLGSDNDTRMLQVHLITQLQEMGLPRSVAVTVVGRHTLPGDPRAFYVTKEAIACSDGSIWPPSESPVVLMETGREIPHTTLSAEPIDPYILANLAKALPKLNTADTIWPMIGWFMAAPLKIAFEDNGYRFPILNVFGTRGSGKTTTILRVFHPLLGYTEERSYDANTTRFVTLSLLGSTNAVPIAFSEFRVATVSDFVRYILLSYDTGRDPRGRPDQTTVDYPLLAPFSVDGEDMLEDPAALERTIAVRMNPHVIEEGTPCSVAFDELRSLNLTSFAGPYIRYVLTVDLRYLLDEAEQTVWSAFPETLPNRVRKNLVVIWTGILMLSNFMAKHGVMMLPKTGARILNGALSNVYSTKLGRAPTEADAFSEVIANAAARGTRAFPWILQDHVLWFQLMPAFEYYLTQRVHQRRTALSRQAIRTQLIELQGEYTVDSCVMSITGKKIMAYGIDIEKAHAAGLDVPTDFKTNVFVIEG